MWSAIKSTIFLLFMFIIGAPVIAMIVSMFNDNSTTWAGATYLLVMAYSIYRVVNKHQRQAPPEIQNRRNGYPFQPPQDFRQQPIRTAPPVQAPEAPATGGRVFGVAGVGIGNSGVFGAEATSAGVAGEQKTGLILERLSKAYPGGYTWHTLSWPGSANADMDHAFAIRAKSAITGTLQDIVFVIDSKMWKSGDYTWDGANAYLNGTKYHEVKFPDAVNKVRAMLPNAQVFGVVAVHNAKSVTTTNRTGTDMIPANELYQYIDSKLVRGSDMPPSFPIISQLHRLKK